MSKKYYIESQGVDLDPQSFYETFSFKTRQFGEDEFKHAVEGVYAETKDESLKDFLYEEYIRNHFKVLNDSYAIDVYWNNTIREVIASNTQKRKLDHAMTHSENVHRKKTEKDRRLSATLTENNIMDFSNEGSSSQRPTINNWEELKANNSIEYELPKLHEKTVAAIKEIMRPKTTTFKRYMKSLLYQQKSPEEAIFLYKIISSIMNAFDTNQELFDLTTLQEPSEADLNNKIWAPIIEALFSKSSVKIRSGDTVLSGVKDNFKVDYRVGIYMNQTFIDISNIEVGKKATVTKVKDDHMKLIMEAKTIIGRIISSYYFIKPSSLPVFSLHICGLKADLLSTTLRSPNNYTTGRVCKRIRLPIGPVQDKQMVNFLQQLVMFKDHIEDMAEHIKQQVNGAMDRRASFGPCLSQISKPGLPNYSDWLQKKDLNNNSTTTTTDSAENTTTTTTIVTNVTTST